MGTVAKQPDSNEVLIGFLKLSPTPLKPVRGAQRKKEIQKSLREITQSVLTLAELIEKDKKKDKTK